MDVFCSRPFSDLRLIYSTVQRQQQVLPAVVAAAVVALIVAVAQSEACAINPIRSSDKQQTSVRVVSN